MQATPATLVLQILCLQILKVLGNLDSYNTIPMFSLASFLIYFIFLHYDILS